MLRGLEFADNGEQIIFNMFDNYKNGSIYVSDWHRFFRSTFTYMQLTEEGV